MSAGPRVDGPSDTDRQAMSWPFAEVVVEVPNTANRTAEGIGDAFTYSIPESLAGAVTPGHAVWVPFGRRRVQGVVVGLSRVSPVARTRDIVSLVDERPWLTPVGIALARWMSAHYLAPFFDCLRALMPPGSQSREVSRYARTDASPTFESKAGVAGGLDRDAQIVLGRFGRTRALSEDTLLRTLGRRRGAARAAIDSLVEFGLIRLETARSGPRISARREQILRRIVDSSEEEDARLRSIRSTPRAEAIAYLRSPETVLPTAEELIAATGVKRAVLKQLEAEGIVTLTPPRRWLETDVSPEAAEDYARGTLLRAPAQAALLAQLAASGGPMEAAAVLKAAGVTESAASGLARRGLVRVAEMHGEVVLNPRGSRARSAEIDARGVAAHAEVLGYLAAGGDVAPAAEALRETTATRRSLKQLEEAGLIVSGERRSWRDPLGDSDSRASPRPALTEDQSAAFQKIEALLGSASYIGTGNAPSMSFPARAPVCLVHGVTGSGKTELYLRSIEHVLFQGRQAIVLVPEIALTAQTIERFAGRFPGRVGLWHSQMSDGERFDTWQRARDGVLDVIVGSRSAIFAPLPRLGLVVVDEEHADSYKQARTPRYHARDVAIHLATLSGALVIMGSATPAVTSYWHAKKGDWHLLDLPRRVVVSSSADSDGARSGRLAEIDAGLPPVSIVDMRAELRAGNTSIFSRDLRAGLAAVLEEGEQAILFLNRRGSATFVLCRDCGHVVKCPRCDVPLTDHGNRSAGSDVLVCHHCNHRESPPMMCPACGGAKIRYFGAGTEKVESELQSIFPDARVLRWDADTTGARGSHTAILARFAGGTADVLIGTQMITKGLDLPLVTLVGVVSADTALHFPDYRATERAFQTLAQVAGRAGRSDLGGRAIFQTYQPGHPAVRYAARHDYAGFYDAEIAFRAAHRYPPWRNLVRLEHVSEGGDAAGKKAGDALKATLDAEVRRLGLPETGVVGPAPAFFHRLRGRTRWQLVVLSPDPHALLEPIALPAGWRIDVDPTDLL